MKENLPDFLIIGAPKSGTTSLYSYLRSHPQVFMSRIKEPRYFAFADRKPQFRGAGGARFNRNVIWRLDEYRRLFAGRGAARAAGEASATYLWAPAAPVAIRGLIPEARLIAILRNPADRAYSHYCHNRRLGREPFTDFRAALDAEPERIAAGWNPNVHYRARGRYGEQIARYLEHFPRERLKVLLQEDLSARPDATLAEVCRFLDVDDSFVFDTRHRHNVTEGLPRRVWINRLFATQSRARDVARRVVPETIRTALFNRYYRSNLDPAPPLDPDLRGSLLAEYREDLLRLQCLIGRDIGAWLDA
jgi:hypothetical protein